MKKYKSRLNEGYEELIANIMQLFRWSLSDRETVQRLAMAVKLACDDTYHNGRTDEIINMLIEELEDVKLIVNKY